VLADESSSVGTGRDAKVILLASRAGWRESGLEEGTALVIPESLPRAARLLGESASNRQTAIEGIWKRLKGLRDQNGISLDFAWRVFVLQSLAERERFSRPEPM
jgi:hypothetical protein